MNVNDLVALLPLIVLAAAIILILLVPAFYRNHAAIATLAVLRLGLAFATVFLSSTVRVTPLLVMDGYARFFMGLMFAAGVIVVLLTYDYLSEDSIGPEEFYILVILATLGAAVLASSSHFASFFLGSEILSISLYALIAYLRTSERSVEAGLKYLVLAGARNNSYRHGLQRRCIRPFAALLYPIRLSRMPIALSRLCIDSECLYVDWQSVSIAAEQCQTEPRLLFDRSP